MESVFTIKEYAQEILLFVVRVDYADINFELGASDVAFHPIAKLFYGFCDTLCYSAVACAFVVLWAVTASFPRSANSRKPLSPATPSERVLERSICSGRRTE